MSYLEDLSKCMNFEGKKFTIGDKDQWRFLVHDHRAVVAALWAARADGVFGPRMKRPLLLRWDRHHDFADWRSNSDLRKFKNITSLNEALAFANNLKEDDGCWARSVLRLGLVANAATFFLGPENHPGADLRHGHKLRDMNGVDHMVYGFDRFSQEFEPQGALSMSGAATHPTITTDLSWSYTDGWDNVQGPLWLDIDLDFAVHEMSGQFRDRPWEDVDFSEEFLSSVPLQPARTSAQVWAPVFARADLITIASEPEYSCGVFGVATIIDRLQRVFEPTNRFSWCGALRHWKV